LKTLRTLRLRLLGTFLVLLATTAIVHSQGTRWGLLNSCLRDAVEDYAKANGGNLPTSWENLDGYLNYQKIETTLNLKIRPAFHLYGATRPKFTGVFGEGTELIAMTAFVIDDDTRPQKGRQATVRDPDGTISTQWVDESVIIAAAQAAKLPAPSTGDLKLPLRDLLAQHEKLLREAPAPNEMNPAPDQPAPAQPASAIAVQPEASFPWEMLAGLATLLVVIAVTVWRRKTHSSK
jgi:hypothetical protein